jgi:glucans biosynthesis protein
MRASVAALLLAFGPSLCAGGEEVLQDPQKFSFAGLRETAKRIAATPYVEPVVQHAEALQAVDYDAERTIRFRAERTMPLRKLDLQFIHLSQSSRQPVTLFLVEDGISHEIRYDAGVFEYHDPSMAANMPRDLGFAGFRVLDDIGNWLVFQGASYFRCVGELNQYGQSARGIAVNTGLPGTEEFPCFTHFWLKPSARDSNTLIVFALLEGKSIAGAYRIEATRNHGVVMTIYAELFARTDIQRMGIAPLTSMFWYDTHNRGESTDWRPEVHDTDGIAIWTGSGECIWRPLNNPSGVQTSSFIDRNPRGFGLQQRDRDFANYQDQSANYHNRPSVWIEPLDAWGDGMVQLIEIPTNDETFDNIVAYWLPTHPTHAGSAWSFRYRLHWLSDLSSIVPNTACVTATRIGRGGNPGQADRSGSDRKFVIDFCGGELSQFGNDDVDAVVTASRGMLVNVHDYRLPGGQSWRAVFDLDVDGEDAVELRCFLKHHDNALSETWLFQFHPGQIAPTEVR